MENYIKLARKLLPKQEKPTKIFRGGWSFKEQVGRNQGIEDCVPLVADMLKQLDAYKRLKKEGITMNYWKEMYGKSSGLFIEGIIAGLIACAWYEDGENYVGIKDNKKTLKEAIKEVREGLS